MILHYTKRAIKDILDNRFLNVVTVITIALTIIIASAFALVFKNASDLVHSWKQGIRIMAYLAPGSTQATRLNVKYKISSISGIQEAVFISKEEALKRLKIQMRRQSSLLENLRENPLPDAFEIRMVPTMHNEAAVESLANRLESLPEIDDVEYGQLWFRRFSNFINLFRLTGYALGILFFMAAVFIVANTIRIVLYSRRDEIEIMRLVGASDGFIKTPFYLEGVILGALGGAIGLAVLFVFYALISSNVEHSLSAGQFRIQFLSVAVVIQIVIGSMTVGWLGCYLSLKQFLKA